MKSQAFKFYYQCITCGKDYSPAETQYLCPLCSAKNKPGSPPAGILKVLYNYTETGANKPDFIRLKQNRFLDLLPLENISSLPNLRVGNTPLYSVHKWDGHTLPFALHLKDDSQNPTFSFKDRASAVVSAYGREQGFKTFVAASTGNAGSSMAGICAAQGQRAIIMVPENAPAAKLAQIIAYGAVVIPVKGSYDDAFDLSVAATGAYGWYNRNTAFNPLTVEGKKTAAFELFENLNFTVPERIFVSTGDGVILSGIYKGYEDLLKLGLISHMPVMVAVQSEGSDNLVRNLGRSRFVIKKSNTIADSISVDIPRNFFMAQQFISKYKGECISVSDLQIMQAAKTLAKETGIFTEPASAAALAGFLLYHHSGQLQEGSDNVVLLTGSGLKDIKPFIAGSACPVAVPPSIKGLREIIEKFHPEIF